MEGLDVALCMIKSLLKYNTVTVFLPIPFCQPVFHQGFLKLGILKLEGYQVPS